MISPGWSRGWCKPENESDSRVEGERSHDLDGEAGVSAGRANAHPTVALTYIAPSDRVLQT
jgi:hypothetical protein